MQHRLHGVAAQHIGHESRVGHIALLASDGLAGDARQPLQHRRVAVGKVVDDDWRVTRLHQRDAAVAADVASAAGQENVHGRDDPEMEMRKEMRKRRC